MFKCVYHILVSMKEMFRYTFIYFFTGMGKEVENLIMENNELLATK